MKTYGPNYWTNGKVVTRRQLVKFILQSYVVFVSSALIVVLGQKLGWFL